MSIRHTDAKNLNRLRSGSRPLQLFEYKSLQMSERARQFRQYNLEACTVNVCPGLWRLSDQLCANRFDTGVVIQASLLKLEEEP